MTEAKSHQTIEVLSRERWSVVSVVESNEYLVTVTPREKLLIANEYIQLRKTVAHMLVDASRLLPDNFALYVIEGVRSVEYDNTKISWAGRIKDIACNTFDCRSVFSAVFSRAELAVTGYSN